jgi:hypothetical protein
MTSMPNEREWRDGMCVFRPGGAASLVDAVERLRDEIDTCRRAGVQKLLVVSTDMRNVSYPSLVDRFLMVEEWAHAGQGEVAVALVVPARYIDPGKFGVKVARDLGLTLDVCDSEADALGWLARQPDRR